MVNFAVVVNVREEGKDAVKGYLSMDMEGFASFEQDIRKNCLFDKESLDILHGAISIVQELVENKRLAGEGRVHENIARLIPGYDFPTTPFKGEVDLMLVRVEGHLFDLKVQKLRLLSFSVEEHSVELTPYMTVLEISTYLSPKHSLTMQSDVPCFYTRKKGV